MGCINFEDHALIKKWKESKKLNVTGEMFKDEKSGVTIKSNLRLLLEIVHDFKVLEFTATWMQRVWLKNYKK
jgi:hypothetical protein